MVSHLRGLGGFLREERRREEEEEGGGGGGVEDFRYGLVWITMGLCGFGNFCMDSWILDQVLCLGFFYEKF